MTESADRILDCRGLSCPMPILRLAKEMKSLQPGQVLNMLGTDPGSKKDVPAWCEKTGNELLSAVEVDGITTYAIRRKL